MMNGRRNRSQAMGSPPPRGRRRNNDFASQPVASSSRRTSSQHQFNSQPNGPSSHNESQQLNDVEIVERANAAAVLALSLAGSGKPFKKADLLQGCRLKGRTAVENVITKARKKLENVYGMKLAEIFPGKFILCVPKDTPFREELATQVLTVSRPFSSLLGVVLSLIYFQKGRVSEEDLRNSMLPKLFPDISTNPHPYFGNVDKLLQEFEQQVYLIKETEPRGGETKVFFKWGPRAQIEFSKKALVVPVLAAIFGGNVPHSVLEELDKEVDPDSGSDASSDRSGSED